MNPMSPQDADLDVVKSGAIAYLVTTGEWRFDGGDPVFGDKVASKHFTTRVDGPYSSVANAERAADLRVAGAVARGYVVVHGQMRPGAIGGVGGGAHGQVVEWRRGLTCRDHTGVFGDYDGWQEIKIVRVDEMP